MTQTALKEPVSQTQLGSPKGFEQYRKSSKNPNLKFLAVGLIIAIAAVAIGVVAMQGSSVYAISLAEFNSKQATITSGGQEVRVAGRVLPGSIVKDATTGAITFTAMDKADKTQTMKVVYSKLPPDTFKDEAEVVVTGTYANGVFHASEMLAKCPSKYSSKAEGQ
jgi:cytochrome c-type biogenesis protein CcmE